MSRRWLFDLGNTRLKLAPLLDDGTPGEVVAVAHDDGDFAAQVARALPGEGETAYLASVASPATTAMLREALAVRFALIVAARTQSQCAGLRIAYADPEKLGVDRFLALLAAHARGGASLVVGVGTALTIDLLDGAGRHHGGRIAPSPALMRAALHQRARQLPETGGVYAEFADDTESALASGCEGAALALIERSHVAAAATLGAAPGLLLHGGGAAALAVHLPQAELASHLVLRGLAHWAASGPAE
jgi:type III pantothenate kinase